MLVSQFVKYFPHLAIAILTFAVGCTPQSESPIAESAVAESDESTEAKGPSKSTAWVECPDGVDPELAKIYAQVVEGSDESDAVSMIDVAMFSTQLAFSLPKDAPEDVRYQLFLQAARALRLGRDGVQGLPSNTIGPILFNEAISHAHFDRIDESMNALNEAVESGFTYLDMIKTTVDLKPVIESDGFEEKFAEWESVAAEKIKEHALEELKNGESFPFNFAGTDVDGNEHSLSDFQGKVLIVDIWGTWCPPCKAEIPSFIRLQEENADRGFQMIGLNYSGAGEPEDEELIKRFVSDLGINYPCIPGAPEIKEQVPGFGGYPTTLFIDRTGKVRMKAVGLHPYEHLNAIVQSLLDE